MPGHIPYKLFASCIPVKGAERSSICDLQRNKIHLIPHMLHKLLQTTQGMTPDAVKALYPHACDDIIDEYFTFLEQEELIFFTNQPELFPDMSLQWHTPSQITNAIIDITPDISYDPRKIMGQLSDLDCKYLELRCYHHLDIDVFKHILECATGSTIISINCILSFDETLSDEVLDMLCNQYSRITGITIHSAPYNKSMLSGNAVVPVTFLQQKIVSPHCCGKITPDYFSSYIETFTESLAYNSCLNRKISIDTEGNIKNCPSMKESFGNIRDTTLQEALNKPGFKKYWNITKDQISVCKDCEFRYICTDCRAYLEDPSDIYSKPLKCGYDPYTCTWEEWSTHPIKQQSIAYYGLQERLRNGSGAQGSI